MGQVWDRPDNGAGPGTKMDKGRDIEHPSCCGGPHFIRTLSFPDIVINNVLFYWRLELNANTMLSYEASRHGELLLGGC